MFAFGKLEIDYFTIFRMSEYSINSRQEICTMLNTVQMHAKNVVLL
jgi:hypothetical protein